MAKVNPEILKWARETAGLTLELASQKLKLNPVRGNSAVARLAALEAGTQEPSRALLVKMAKQYRRPLLTFYMSTPPRRGDRGQDFRKLPKGHSSREDVLLDALLRDVQARQSIVRAVLEDEQETEPIAFVGSVETSIGMGHLVTAIRETLQLNLAEFRSERTPEKAFSLLREKAQAQGVFVLLIGDLGSHHTAIDLEIFRGFALADKIAPFIVINDQDSRTAWSFTLLHELVHLWLGQTGVSGIGTDLEIERFCNDVAGEFLLPTQELRELPITGTTTLDMAENLITKFAKERNISSQMVAYKLFRRSIINLDAWKKLDAIFRQKRFVRKRPEKTGDPSGPDYYVVRRHRLGEALIDLVSRTVSSGTLSTTKAGKVLGVHAKNVGPLIHRVAHL